MILPKIQPIKAVKLLKEMIKEEQLLRDQALRDFVETIIHSTIITFSKNKKVIDVAIDGGNEDFNKFFSIGRRGIYFSPYDFLDEFNRFIKEVANSKEWAWTTIDYSFHNDRMLSLLLLNKDFCYDFLIRIKEVEHHEDGNRSYRC